MLCLIQWHRNQGSRASLPPALGICQRSSPPGLEDVGSATMMLCLGQWHPMMQDAVGHPDLKKKKKKNPLSIMRVGYSLHLRTEHTMKQLVESEFNMTVFPSSLNKLLP